jgi:hypothetical protein
MTRDLRGCFRRQHGLCAKVGTHASCTWESVGPVSAPAGAARRTPAPAAGRRRTPLRPLRSPGLRQPLRADARPPDQAHEPLAPTGEADGRGLGGSSRLELPGRASGTAPGATRRARGRPSGAARPRWRTAARSAGRAVLELQRAKGVESAAALSPARTRPLPGLRLALPGPQGSPVASPCRGSNATSCSTSPVRQIRRSIRRRVMAVAGEARQGFGRTTADSLSHEAGVIPRSHHSLNPGMVSFAIVASTLSTSARVTAVEANGWGGARPVGAAGRPTASEGSACADDHSSSASSSIGSDACRARSQ